LERAAERQIDNERSRNPESARAGLKRAQLELSVIESQLRFRGLLGWCGDNASERRVTWQCSHYNHTRLLLLRS
jgi:hypothetical protein